MKNEKLTMIDVKDIYPHPDNTRKNVGDVTELSDSIKKNGIMQNLTVIPGHYENGELVNGGYTLIIGHRRCAAAKEAGVTMVPCRIVEDMDKKEQVSTMLEENMQRNDLTVFEQAQGFQMMLDLGETEETISEKTGFSRKTVKHRLNMAKLDQVLLKEKTDEDGVFQLSLKDLYELEKIKDVKKRNKVLKEAHDSRDLVWRAKQAAEEETMEENRKKLIILLKEERIKKAPAKAINERYSGKWKIIKEIDLREELPESIDGCSRKKDVQWMEYYGKILIMVPVKQKEKKKTDWEIEREKKEKNKKELKRKQKEMFRKMDKFIRMVVDGEIEPVKEDVDMYRSMIKAIVESNTYCGIGGLCSFYSGKGMWQLENDNPEEYEKFIAWEKGLSDLHKIIICLGMVREKEIYGYNEQYMEEKANSIKSVFKFLERYGFSITEDEKKVLDGTHELYMKKEGKGQ